MGWLLNPFHLHAGGLLAFAIVAHAVGDFALQNEWMALHKSLRRPRARRVADTVRDVNVQKIPGGGVSVSGRMHARTVKQPGPWWDRHPAALCHAAIHLLLLLPVMGLAAIAVAVVHLAIDTRWPLKRWMAWYGHSAPDNRKPLLIPGPGTPDRAGPFGPYTPEAGVPFSLGHWVAMEVDQSMHLGVLAIAVIVITLVT